MNESSPSGFYKMMDIPKSEEDFQVSGTHMMQVVPRA
jgi:negative regulator of genetic competence, sporulation and motility